MRSVIKTCEQTELKVHCRNECETIKFCEKHIKVLNQFPQHEKGPRGLPWSCTVWNPDKEGTKMDLRQKALFSSENDIKSAKSDRNVSQFNLETN